MSTPPGAEAPATPPAVAAALPTLSADALLLVDADARLRWCNGVALALIGHPPSALGDARWPECLAASAETHTVLRQLLSATLSEPARPATAPEIQIRVADGSATWWRVEAHRLPPRTDDRADTAPCLFVLRETTATRRAEREAQRLSDLLAMAQEFGRLGVWEREIPSGRGRWDRHMFGFWGMAPREHPPSFEDAISHLHPDDRAQLNYLESTRRAGRYTHRYRIIRPDGSMRWMQSQWEVKNSDAGRPERAIGILMDDTEVYELARSLDSTSAQLRLAIGLGNIAIWRHDLGSGRVHFNTRAQQVMGIAHDAGGVSLDEMRSRVHPDDVERVAVAAAQALTADRPTDIEARFGTPDRGWRTLLTRRVLERAADGKPVAFVGIALDVTEQADERRRATEQMRRMELATAAAGVGIWSYDTVTDVAQWNAQMYTLVGRAPEAGAPNRQQWEGEVLHPADRERIRRSRAELDALPDGAGEQRFRVVLPGGEVRWLENRVRREVLDGHLTVLGVTLDITDRHRAEEALRNADERAALAARGAGIGTWEMALDGDDERWDEQMYRLRGLEPRARPPAREERLALVHPQDRLGVFDSRPGAAADPLPASYEFRVRWPDGSYRWLASRSIALFDDAGIPVRRIGVNWDINDARAAEADRQERELARRENLAKSQFLSRVSHELRTPLNAVLGFAQIMLDEAGLSAAQQQHLGLIRSAGEHLLLLINDMLDLTGLETGEMRLSLQPVALDTLLAETLPLVAPLAARQGVTLRAGAVAAAVQADRTRLRQVLINLLSNGIKYNRAQGEVTISASTAAGRVTLVVSDSGRGLTTEQLAHLFEPFNRLGVEREGIEGSGIGLVIVKALVERMGGTVGVSSEPGQGTKFAIELAAADAAPGPAPIDGVGPAAPVVPRRGRLLYIEDNPVNVLLVQELVAYRPGLELAIATSGDQGVRQALAVPPDLVLVDMQLPDFDGFEVLRRLRADPRTRGLRCIALSANALTEDIARALAAGFADYWTKPVQFGRFLAGLDVCFADTAAAAG